MSHSALRGASAGERPERVVGLKSEESELPLLTMPSSSTSNVRRRSRVLMALTRPSPSFFCSFSATSRFSARSSIPHQNSNASRYSRSRRCCRRLHIQVSHAVKKRNGADERVLFVFVFPSIVRFFFLSLNLNLNLNSFFLLYNKIAGASNAPGGPAAAPPPPPPPAPSPSPTPSSPLPSRPTTPPSTWSPGGPLGESATT